MKITHRALADAGLLVLVNAMWAGQYAAYKVATEKMGPVTVSGWSFLLASAVLLPFLILGKGGPATAAGSNSAGGTERPDPGGWLWSRHSITEFLVISIFGLLPGSVLLAWGVDRSTASNAAVIYLTMPVITAVLAATVLQEKMTLVKWGSLVISLVGVLILSSSDLRHLQLLNGRFLFGNALVLVACAGSSFYNVYCKDLLRRFTPLQVLIYGYLLTLAASLPLMRWTEHFSLASVRGYRAETWIALIVLGSGSWGLAMVLWMFLLKRLEVSRASVSIYLLPFLGVVISAVTLHEKITPVVLTGGAVTLAGTILITSLESSLS